MTSWKEILRGFIAHGGRVLVQPTGELSESGAVPPWFLVINMPEAETAMAAHRAYFAEQDPAFRAKVRRAALMLGRRTSNGWRVLEA